MFWYGPGFIRGQDRVNRPVTSADIAPTEADLLHFDFHAPDGTPMTEALVPAADRKSPPKLIVTMVWDAGGRDVLDAWKDEWPYLKSLIPKGTWYEHATVGSSPTSTAQIHATMGTGAYPNKHGIVGHHLVIGDQITGPYSNGLSYLILPTLADLFDRHTGDQALVGLVGTVSIHLGMMGHGSDWGGGDRDIAVLRTVQADTLGAEGFRWNLPDNVQPYYRFPAYTNAVPGFEGDVQALDRADGRLDGKWRNNQIEPLLKGFDTPARTPYETRVIEEIVKREGFGTDEVPDLLFLNYKEIDYISHVWTMNSPEMKDAVVAQDRALKTFVEFLNRQVGAGNWAMVVTADHGALPSPKVTGGFQISTSELAARINGRFDRDGDNVRLVEGLNQTQVIMNRDEVKRNHVSLDQVSQYLMTFTKSMTAGAGTTIPPGHGSDRVFQAVFPSSMMESLPCLPEARP